MDGFWGNLLIAVFSWILGLFSEFFLKIVEGVKLKIANKVKFNNRPSSKQKATAIGWNVNVHQASEQSGPAVSIGRQEDLLGPPTSQTVQNRTEAGTYLVAKLTHLLGNETAALRMQADLALVNKCRETGDRRGQASALVNQFTPVVGAIEGRGHLDTSDALRIQISRLSEIGIQGISSEEITMAESEINSILYRYFQKKDRE